MKPPIKKLISVRLSDADIRLLRRMAAKFQTTQADVISRALEKYSEFKSQQ